MDYFISIAILILIFIILTQSYNLVLGYTGMIHVGHIAFMAIGAYTSALITIAGMPFWFGALSGIVVAGFVGLMLALPTVRFRDDYIVAATLGMGEIIRLIILNERALTGGSTGLTKIARPTFFGIILNNNASLFIFVLVMALASLALVWRTVHSPFGKVLESIREDEIASQSLGNNTQATKVKVLVIASMLAGLSGVLYAHATQFIDPPTFGITRMTFVLLIVMFGGIGNFWGPIVGTAALMILVESIRFLPLPDQILGALRWIIYASVLIVVIILKPKGIMGEKSVRKKL